MERWVEGWEIERKLRWTDTYLPLQGSRWPF